MKDWPRQPLVFDFFDWCEESWWRVCDFAVGNRALGRPSLRDRARDFLRIVAR